LSFLLPHISKVKGDRFSAELEVQIFARSLGCK